jgi:hypothetical protein
VIKYICKKLLKFFNCISEDITALKIGECISRWSSMSYGGNIEANINSLKFIVQYSDRVWGTLEIS